MKVLFCLLILVSFSATADEFKFVKRMSQGPGDFDGDALMDGDRLIFVWPAETFKEVKPKDYSPELKKGKTEPYTTFKTQVHEMYKKFNDLARTFNSCTEGKKWPESKECMKEFKYCFGRVRDNSCDIWGEENRGKRCRMLPLGKCLDKVEAQFNFLKNCFNPKNSIGFSFIAYDEKGNWEEPLGIRATGNDGDWEAWSCDFTYLNGEFNLVQIRSSAGTWERVGVPLPDDYKWKHK